jgi:osmotically-inducible protein OsmY
LSGTIKEGDVSSQAELIAASTPGVRKVQNRLIAAALFEWD